MKTEGLKGNGKIVHVDAGHGLPYVRGNPDKDIPHRDTFGNEVWEQDCTSNGYYDTAGMQVFREQDGNLIQSKYLAFALSRCGFTVTVSRSDEYMPAHRTPPLGGTDLTISIHTNAGGSDGFGWGGPIIIYSNVQGYNRDNANILAQGIVDAFGRGLNGDPTGFVIPSESEYKRITGRSDYYDILTKDIAYWGYAKTGSKYEYVGSSKNRAFTSHDIKKNSEVQISKFGTPYHIDYYGMIRNSVEVGVPRVFLAEGMYHDNPLEACILMSNRNLKIMAEEYCKAICQILEEPYIAETPIYLPGLSGRTGSGNYLQDALSLHGADNPRMIVDIEFIENTGIYFSKNEMNISIPKNKGDREYECTTDGDWFVTTRDGYIRSSDVRVIATKGRSPEETPKYTFPSTKSQGEIIFADVYFKQQRAETGSVGLHGYGDAWIKNTFDYSKKQISETTPDEIRRAGSSVVSRDGNYSAPNERDSAAINKQGVVTTNVGPVYQNNIYNEEMNKKYGKPAGPGGVGVDDMSSEERRKENTDYLKSKGYYGGDLDLDNDSSSMSVVELLEKYNPDLAKELAKKAGMKLDQYMDLDRTMSGVPLEWFDIIHGMPFQFLPSTDPRPSAPGSSEMETKLLGTDKYSTFGLYYLKEHAARTPIVTFIPGEPVFLPGLKDESKNDLIGVLQGGTATMQGLSNLLLKHGPFNKVSGLRNLKYYDFEPHVNEYFMYVNMMCSAHAVFAGIGNETIGGERIKDIDWSKYNNSRKHTGAFNWLNSLGKHHMGVSFAYDPGSDISQTFSNSTTESQMGQFTKNVSAKAREIAFLLGGAKAGISLESFDNDTVEQIAATMKELEKHGNVVDRLMRDVSVISSGANLMFPEIWNDSSYSTDYSIDLKFRSPYADPISKYLYVAVPYYHCLALALPRTITETAYHSPFIIKAFSKGNFDISMGMVDTLSVKRYGDGDNLSADLLPMAMDITISMKDLYKCIHMTRGDLKRLPIAFNNTGFLEMIGNNAGVSMGMASFGEKVGLYFNNLGGILRNADTHFVNWVFESTNLESFIKEFKGYGQGGLMPPTPYGGQ